MDQRLYDDDLTDAQWAAVEPLIPAAKTGGHPRTVVMRKLLDAIFYVVRGGNAWRKIPNDYGHPWSTVYHYFRAFKKDGTWTRIHDALREQVRTAEGRQATPSAGVLDSQSVKTTRKGGSRSASTRPRRSRAASATS